MTRFKKCRLPVFFNTVWSDQIIPDRLCNTVIWEVPDKYLCLL